MAQSFWPIDPDDPRAPPQELWDRLSAEERARIVEALPPSIPLEVRPPEGDTHRIPKDKARDALSEFFRSIGRRIYVTSELVTYYPGEQRFCPDILAVLDVEPHPRTSWIVSKEGKGLDLVIEIHVAGQLEKDLQGNVVRYARLGIREYFVFDRPRSRVFGYRLPPGANAYERIVPQDDRLASEVFGLALTVEGSLLRFYYGTAALPFMDELVGKLRAMVAELVTARDEALQRAEEEKQRAEEEKQRAEEEKQRAEEEKQRAEEEKQRADVLARRVAELVEELERMRRGG